MAWDTWELLVLRPCPGPEKESWVVVRETHQVLDKLFPKFLKGNILLLHGSWTFSPEALPSPILTPLSGRWKTWTSVCDLKSGSQFPCLQDGEVRTV